MKLRLSPGYLFIAPAVILIIIMAVYPTFRVVYLSVMDYSRVSKEMVFVGMDNYTKIIADANFQKAIIQTLKFSLFSTAGHIVFGLILALIMNAGLNRRFVNTSRALILLPWALSPIVVAILAQLWSYPLISPIAKILESLGYAVEFNPLGRTGSALWTLIIINIWQFTPFFMLMMLAGLQTIAPSLDDAAMVDGASTIQKIRYITIPHLRNLILTLLLFDLVTTAAYFDLIWVTTQGGPVRSTEVLATYMYRIGFLTLDWNRAATVGVILLVLCICIAALVVFQLRED
ncbi:MAG: sugar ABC transporter permease [Anaerolineales bacterium]|nr:sugar ABC transporter permease [Anaerolineales bacterium]